MPTLVPDGKKIPGVHFSHGDIMGPFHDYLALFQAWSRFGEYSRWRGDNLYVLPVHSYQMTHIQSDFLPVGNEAYRDRAGIYGYRPIDLAPARHLEADHDAGRKVWRGNSGGFPDEPLSHPGVRHPR